MSHQRDISRKNFVDSLRLFSFSCFPHFLGIMLISNSVKVPFLYFRRTVSKGGSLPSLANITEARENENLLYLSWKFKFKFPKFHRRYSKDSSIFTPHLLNLILLRIKTRQKIHYWNGYSRKYSSTIPFTPTFEIKFKFPKFHRRYSKDSSTSTSFKFNSFED